MNLLSDLSQIQNFQSRSISAENPDGAKGGGAQATTGTGAAASQVLGRGWKVSPSRMVGAHETITLADIKGPGSIRHFWLTCAPEHWRQLYLNIYWDNQVEPAVSVPVGDFFCNGWQVPVNVNSLPVAVNPTGGFNSYWDMPFQKHARIEVKNLAATEFPLYYQVDYLLMPVPKNVAYFYAYWHRSKPLAYKAVHTVLPKITGRGHYVGTYVAYQSNSNGWWGEGEMKFYLDGDDDYPTICGTGTEDYFGGAWNFEQPKGAYCSFSTAYAGLPQVIKPDGLYQSQQRLGMYRWHVQDPVYFASNLNVTLQSLGWRKNGQYLPQQDDIASTAYFYLDTPQLAGLHQIPDEALLENS